MSHKATTWLASIPPDDITHGEFRVLFHLCDCHNPSAGCFPSQGYLRRMSGGSNGGINKWLLGLEEKGLIERELDFDPITKKRKPTQYTLGFEMDRSVNAGHVSGFDNDTKPTPLSGDGANSTFDAKPTPLSGNSQLHPSGVVLKDKPVIKPVIEPCASEAEPQTIFNLEIFASKFLDAFPRIGSKSKVVAALEKAVTGGADPDQVLAGASAYAAEQKGNEARYIAFAENWLEQKRWANLGKPNSEKVATRETVNIQRAQAIIEGRSWTIGSTSPDYARELVHLGLVTEAQCRATGVRL
ncbi:helix-turn-helix domain-containing protein [Falsihalocynthiibacter sp. S25ZX9]|uniref:helix-turn-helix domain-containing protein n=1 Tax=Falsihalocynthiibacter sp. S25ZX9 TaxID=3240870 RepID=UPI00351065D6